MHARRWEGGDGGIRWLHLSDFHVGKDDYGQEKVFSYLLDHIKCQKTPDFVFITGDIANTGQASQYQVFVRDFIQPLQNHVGPECHLFIVPGNHDVDRVEVEAISRSNIVAKMGDYFEPTHKGLAKREKSILSGVQAFDEHIKTPDDWLRSAAGFHAWCGEVRGVKLGVLCLNTAWLSQDDADKEQLSPGKSMVEAQTGLGFCCG